MQKKYIRVNGVNTRDILPKWDQYLRVTVGKINDGFINIV
jgi:hypothetical protein